MSGIQIGNHSLPPSYVPPTTGAPSGNSGDGINYPYDPNGPTPNFWINWSDPNLTVAQIEQQYEGLMDWLKENPGSCYNGSVLLLQFTTDIAQHMKDPQFAGSNLAQFLSNQFYEYGGRYYLQDVIQLAAYGCAVSQPNEQAGLSAATAFLQAIQSATSGVTGLSDLFAQMNSEATTDLGTIGQWCSSHYVTLPGAPTGTWMDDESSGGSDPTITGPQPYQNFSQFANDAGFYLGSIIQPPSSSNSSVTNAIDGMWGVSMQQIFEQYKNNPWLILYMLLSHVMLGLDTDKGRAVNGYSGILTTIKNANTLVGNMLADLNAPKFNAQDFYSNLAQLKELVGTDPSLANVYTTLQQDVGQINTQTATGDTSYPKPGDPALPAGYYNFPPGTYTINGTQYTIAAGQNNVLYVPAGATITAPGTANLTYAQLAAMGDYSAINTAMNATDFSQTLKGTFTNAMTAMTNALNSQSAAINNLLSQQTQWMQALENFVKQMFSNTTSVIQTFVKNVQSVIS